MYKLTILIAFAEYNGDDVTINGRKHRLQQILCVFRHIHRTIVRALNESTVWY